ncbi:CYFA0S03e04368g1_1 [Cyberlindnera fabianii]|uniref:CYFA0S03e04368g1_1 n=1 Tax=Cyberlindnera fabianii TaxID=36022 RepID=A0A061AQW2_CYBFA|nr:CYFA0S03e04368g1_1 [Cyberlindnera fabianii]
MSKPFDDPEKVSVESTGSVPSLHEGTVDSLNRSLSPRQISMISIAGVIGTGLYLGTGPALSKGGPLSLLLNYSIIGGLVYLVMLALGEMSAFMPIAGSFCSFAKKFGCESFGFAILINYWLNDAVSVASDLTALQLVMGYWTDFHFWVISLIFWVFLLFLNIVHVKFYGETEYWLALLKVIAIVAFFIVSIVVNAGHNSQHEYIGFKYWSMGDAPFVNGFKGFSQLFVTASFAFGGTESITITAGSAKNPVKSTMIVTKTVFYRIIIFYVFSVFFIGMNVPYNYPNLSTKSVVTSPFTIVFQEAGSKAAGSFMNAVILTSVISAGNHALYAGSMLAYTLGTDGYLPKILTWKNRYQTPYVAVLITWLAGGLCFGSSFVGAGELWTWLQNIVGVSNQLAWLSIGITSIRFRRGLAKQGRTDELQFKNWTYPFGPYVIVVFTTFILLVQGWSAFSPWSVYNFFQAYLELLVFPTTFLIWFVFHWRDRFKKAEEMDFDTDRYHESDEELADRHKWENLKGWAKVKNTFYQFFV